LLNQCLAEQWNRAGDVLRVELRQENWFPSINQSGCPRHPLANAVEFVAMARNRSLVRRWSQKMIWLYQSCGLRPDGARSRTRISRAETIFEQDKFGVEIQSDWSASIGF